MPPKLFGGGGAGGGDATEAKQDTIIAYLTPEVADILVDTGTTIPTQITTVVGAEFDGTPNVYDVEVTGYDSTAITPDEDGSILERLEWLQQNFGRAQTDADMGASTTVIDCLDLAGFGDDYFNQGWQLGVILNNNSHGNAPENQWRDITDYSSVDGVFTCAAFGANVEANDYIMVARDEIVKTFQASQRAVHSMTFWSDQDDEITLTTTATDDFALPNITIAGLPTGITLLRVIAILKIALFRDTSTANNAINGATALQVDADVAYGSLVSAITIPDNSWKIVVATSSDRGGDVMIGNIDVKAEITGNGTFYARLENIACDGNNLLLEDVQWGLQIYFTL